MEPEIVSYEVVAPPSHSQNSKRVVTGTPTGYQVTEQTLEFSLNGELENKAVATG